MQLSMKVSVTSIIASISSLISALLYFAFFTSLSAYIAYALAIVLSAGVFLLSTALVPNAQQPQQFKRQLNSRQPNNNSKRIGLHLRVNRLLYMVRRLGIRIRSRINTSTTSSKDQRRDPHE